MTGVQNDYVIFTKGSDPLSGASDRLVSISAASYSRSMRPVRACDYKGLSLHQLGCVMILHLESDYCAARLASNQKESQRIT